jgi:uncharacterized membrane protein
MPDKDSKKTDDKSWVYLAIYVFGMLGGIIGYITAEKDDKKVRFHSLQAIFLGIVMMVCWFLFFLIIPLFLVPIIWLYGLYVGYKAYTGETVRIPYLAEYADKYA